MTDRNVTPSFDDLLHRMDVAIALVDTARAAQAGLSQLDHEGLGVADWQPLREALNRWLSLTGQPTLEEPA